LLREAQAAGRVHHPNVVDIYDVGEHAGSLFLVMERLHGRPLSDVLDEGPVPPGELLASLLPALRGVAAAHRQGVIHRDLKPSNIFLCCDDSGETLGAKVLDFGVSKMRSTLEAGGETLTRSGAVMGTPLYMAPELFDEARSIDLRADIYALGVILYRGLSGEMPFRAETYPQLVLKVSMSAARPLHDVAPSVPKALCDVVMHALERDPDARYQDVPSLVRALEPFAGRTAIAVTVPDRESEPEPSTTPLATDTRVRSVTVARATPLRAFLAGVGLAGASIGVFFALRGAPAAETREQALPPSAAAKPPAMAKPPAPPVSLPLPTAAPVAAPAPTPLPNAVAPDQTAVVTPASDATAKPPPSAAAPADVTAPKPERGAVAHHRRHADARDKAPAATPAAPTPPERRPSGTTMPSLRIDDF
ncbi:MAG TPA: serine/threonine-protein kinase, partial [Polyangiales bacterium]|nr:serine/threonine-protein kinase [Polyangiales bacterium]